MTTSNSLDGTVSISTTIQPSGVLEVAGADGLLDGEDVTRVGIALRGDLDSFTKLHELISNVADSSEGL